MLSGLSYDPVRPSNGWLAANEIIRMQEWNVGKKKQGPDLINLRQLLEGSLVG